MPNQNPSTTTHTHLITAVSPTRQRLATHSVTAPGRVTAAHGCCLCSTRTRRALNHHHTGGTGSGVAGIWAGVTTWQHLATHTPGGNVIAFSGFVGGGDAAGTEKRQVESWLIGIDSFDKRTHIYPLPQPPPQQILNPAFSHC